MTEKRKWYRVHFDLYLTNEQVEGFAARFHEVMSATLAEVFDAEPAYVADAFMAYKEEDHGSIPDGIRRRIRRTLLRRS